MFEEKVKSICISFTHRGFGVVSVDHLPTNEEPYLTCHGDKFSCYHNFGKAQSNTLDIDISGSENNSVSADKVKLLREKYGYGVMDCKKALQKANGDMKLAYNILRGWK